MAKKLVRVTAEDIANGVAGNPYRCPIALAIKRTFPSENYVGVSRESVTFGIRWLNSQGVDLPISARKFIQRFDSTQYGGPALSVKPFNFYLDPDKTWSFE